ACRAMLVPLDGDGDHEQALPVVTALAGPWGAALKLLTVVPAVADLAGPMSLIRRFVPGTAQSMLELSAQEAGDYLQELIRKLTAAGLAAESLVARGDPARVIAAQADGLADGVVVLASHGRSGLSAFWEGSVASRVAGLTRRPLLLIPVHRGATGRAGAREPNGRTPGMI
ncbi:MAG TPA: universal stress protein, partial [Candidatus Aminicenantes bacterium]|nr:universal stress protein [Candidatus Aminicenantes bacterium]